MAYTGHKLSSLVNSKMLPKSVGASTTWTLTSDDQEVVSVEGISTAGLFFNAGTGTLNVSVTLEGTVDGSTWFDFATATYTASNAQKLDVSYVRSIRVKSVTNNAAASISITDLSLYKEEAF